MKGADYFAPRIASFAALATRNFTTRLAGIWMVSPVLGLRPRRAARLREHELADAGQREGVLRVLVSERGNVFENFAGLLLGNFSLFGDERGELSFGECFCHSLVLF